MIRRAAVSDAAAIARLHVASWRTTYAGIVDAAYLDSLNETARVPGWEEQLKNPALDCLVAEDAGKLLGFSVGGPIREPLAGYGAELYAIYLLREAQGRGVGRALFGETVAALRARGFQGVAAWVMRRNPARVFYERMGGVPAGSTEMLLAGETFKLAAYGWA
ncbi:MAG: GNAT family N-acetyltransferase [Verrucomicrobium sp.]|nr:GNAT family N-acetyltransferase [Verrucomicrobium sp.]